MEYVAVFFTHSGAIKYNKYLSSMNIENQITPTPRKLSSNCGIAIRFSFVGNIAPMINEDIEKIFRVEDNSYILEYEE